MAQVILVLIPIALLIFRAWMCYDLTQNDNLHKCFIIMSGWRDARLDWSVAFIFLNWIIAFFYYVYECRLRRQARSPP